MKQLLPSDLLVLWLPHALFLLARQGCPPAGCAWVKRCWLVKETQQAVRRQAAGQAEGLLQRLLVAAMGGWAASTSPSAEHWPICRPGTAAATRAAPL